MELKDLVLSTLEELDEKIEKERFITQEVVNRKVFEEMPQKENSAPEVVEKADRDKDDEVAFLTHTKERLQILFEGLKSEEITHHEQKLELTLKYLQLLFAQVEQRLEAKEK